MSLRGAIAALSSGGPYTVTRTEEGAFDDAGVYSSGPAAHAIADDIVESVDATANTLALTAHALETGDGPIRFRNRIALVYPDATFTATNADDTLHAVAHGLETGDGPFRLSNAGGALPSGLVATTDYWVIKVDANSFQLAVSLDAVDSATAVEFDDNGTGTQTIADTVDTQRAQDDLPAGLELDTDYWVVVLDDDTVRLAASVADSMAVPAVVLDLSTVTGSGITTLVDTSTTQRRNQTTFAIVASVQPVTGRELRDADAQRGDEVQVVYTQTEIRTRSKTTDPDRILLDDELWTVTKVERFDAFGETHYRAYVARTENP